MNKIMFFAYLRDAVGEEFLTLDVKGLTIQELKKKISEQYSNINLETVMTAINEEFASDSDIIKESDEIAFIPPVSGG